MADLRAELSQLKEKWTKSNQGHVFQWENNLTNEELASFVSDLKNIDVDESNKIYNAAKNQEEADKNSTNEIKPFESVTTFANSTSEQRKHWESVGLSLISEGKVAILLLAGGQATRLGCVFPKGMYDIGLPSKKSLYQLQVERSIKLQQIATQQTGKTCSVPWYIMTSPATEAQTKKFFKDNKYFGAQEKDFFFFNQHMVPCLTPEGKIISETKSKIALSPNGNGGLYKALYTSGALDDMQRRGILYITQYCVDNCLIRPADPVFVGFMHDVEADCAAKIVPKAYPEEPVGVMANINGRSGVIEYSEITPAMRNQRNENGDLIYSASHICINNFSLKLLLDVAKNHLEEMKYHIARKKIPHANENGDKVAATKENGWKLEMFIFDAFQFAKKMVAMEVLRDEEFSPLKNAAGAPKDSPETCLRDFCHLHTKYIVKAGGTVTPNTDSSKTTITEVSPLVSYSGESLEQSVSGKTFTAPVYIH